LLKLKRVEIQGFKSFYDRTEMKFNGSGIAAVVGPNGCGKSNLSDAISWVLGEQSAKSLRGTRMEDVIFSGTREKKALGMASVTMTLIPDEVVLAPANAASAAKAPETQNSQEQPESTGTEAEAQERESKPMKADVVKAAENVGEITITRRLYRSGDSEYLINGKLARLRDIQDLFLGTGLGPESYAIIEQGRIGQILSNKPQDRRNVIEEAAGITKFKTRKRLAEAKLESAKGNLSRVFDILEEVNRQVNSLKRQAAKTKRFSELKEEGAIVLRQVLSARFRLLQNQLAQLAADLQAVLEELEGTQAAIAEREADQTGVLEASYGTEQALTAERKKLADLHLELERARGKIDYQTRQVESIEKRVGSGEEEAHVLEQQAAERWRELEVQTGELETLQSEGASAREELNAKAAERAEAQNELAEGERALEAARQTVLRLLGEAAGIKNRMTQTEAQLASAEREQTRAKNEEQHAENDLVRITSVKTQLSERLQRQQSELISITGQRKNVEEELQGNRLTLNETRRMLDALHGEYSRIKARRDSLEEVIQHHSYTTETVKRLFTAVEKGKAQNLQPIGVLADFLEVDPQLEKAVEEFLHDELEYVVVKGWADAERGIELIRSDLDGRATFLVEGNTAEETTRDLPQPGAEDGIWQRLTDALRLTNGLVNMPLGMLHRLKDTYVVDDRHHACQLAQQFPHCWFLTRDGVNYHGRAVSGGKKTGAGPLALKRELREVSQGEKAKKAELETVQKDVADLESTLANLAEQQESLRSKQQAQEKDVLALDHESRKLDEERSRAQSRLSNARLELHRLAHDGVKLQNILASDGEALNRLEQARAEGEDHLEAAREDLSDLRTAVAQAGEEHAALRANLASIEERQRSAGAHKIRLQTQVQDLTNRRANLLRETARLTAERTHLLQSNAEEAHRLSEFTEWIAQSDAQVKQLAEREGALRSRLATLEEELKSFRGQAQVAQERRSELQVAIARVESDLQHLDETSQKELGKPLSELTDVAETLADEYMLPQLESKYAEVRRKIEALGPVNPQALEEFEEAQGRQEFLTAQRQDLLDSIRDTEKAISEIDVESQRRFGEAFTAINVNFREMFKTLFGGGTGEMRLTDEGNLAESGIDIVASPPGKRLQSVLLLSGGEKSLTAMALLMAIFQYTPSPFCVLDEVDAPLDEPNIERLTKLLRAMAEQTQFIVITHSQRTMEAAQSLYGVTMQEPGISKLVSVKFKETDQGQRVHKTVVESSREQEPALVQG
jgi:chromosome segregation protein